MKYFHLNKTAFLLACFCHYVCTFEPITLTVGGATLSWAGYMLWDPIKRNTICRLRECCDENNIKPNFKGLRSDLQSSFYGQHIAQEVVLNALKAHFTDKHLQKPLTLSLHGLPGTGKNFITNFIKKNIYKKGSASSYVHSFTGRLHFPLEENVQQYKRNLYDWVKGNITKCERSMFIFDEVDKMAPGVLNVIKPILDYNEIVDGIDYRKAIFIFLSNTGAKEIKDQFLRLWKNAVNREDVQLRDFEELITRGAFNEAGGFYLSDTIRNNLIDHYIPFLPMEEEHVMMCIKDQFRIRGVYSPKKEDIEEAQNFVQWDVSSGKKFSMTGCKRLSQKVGIIAQKYRKEMA